MMQCRVASILTLYVTLCATAQACQTPAASEEQLVNEQAKIGAITFVQKPIFDPNNPREDGWIQQLANRLHITTKTSALRAQLLFAEGDPYNARLLAETERNLRLLNYLRNPEVRTVCYHDGVVDIEIHTRDVWSLSPTLSFGRSGGRNGSAFGIQDYNFLGYGKTLELERKSNRERDSSLLIYRDPNLFYSRRTLELAVSSNSDGKNYGLALAQPFHELDAKRQWRVAGNVVEREESRSVFGSEIDRYQRDGQNLELTRGWSNGLIDGRTWRRSIGWRFDRQRFAPLAASTLAVPENRSESYPFVRIERIDDDFDTIINQDQIGRVEDRAFGQRMSLELGHDFRNQQSSSIINASWSDGFRLQPAHSLFAEVNASARFGRAGYNPQRIDAALKYYWRQSDAATLFLSGRADYGRELFADQPVVLGGENGLRAYAFDYQYGSRGRLFSIEQRYYTNYQLFGLFQVGAAAFFYMGKVIGDRIVPAQQFGWLKDVGFGLRLGNSRSARGNALHIDFAYALDGRPEDQKFDVIIETRSSF